jgi:hypothetical protein
MRAGASTEWQKTEEKGLENVVMSNESWTKPSLMMLIAVGVILVGIGVYFIFFRPALLPEDIRYMRLTDTQTSTLAPALSKWLRLVFAVLGGFASATGVLVVSIASAAFHVHSRIAVVGSAVAGISSIGLMTGVNFVIGSDFKWVLLAVLCLWIGSFVAYGLERAKA